MGHGRSMHVSVLNRVVISLKESKQNSKTNVSARALVHV